MQTLALNSKIIKQSKKQMYPIIKVQNNIMILKLFILDVFILAHYNKYFEHEIKLNQIYFIT